MKIPDLRQQQIEISRQREQRVPSAMLRRFPIGMAMAVDETRQGEAAAKINDSPRSFGVRRDRLIAAERQDSAATDGNGLGVGACVVEGGYAPSIQDEIDDRGHQPAMTLM